MIKYIIFNIFNLLFVSSLLPKRLPNGNIVKFTPNKNDPTKDLLLVTPGKASIITKNWLNNIIMDIFNSPSNVRENGFNKKGLFEYDELHIVQNINKLEEFISSTYTQNYKENENTISKNIFLVWNPIGNNGKRDELFIIGVQIHLKNKEFIIKHLIQSPYWDPIQIDSIELKKALIIQNKKNNCTKINFDYLFENSNRFKYSWQIWELESDNDIK